MAAAVASSSSSHIADMADQRKFEEISLDELSEVLSLAKDAMDPRKDCEAWLHVLEAVSELQAQRDRERKQWRDKLNTLSANLSTLRATHPRASWRTPSAHSQQLAQYGQRTLELAKQISKLEAAISRAESDVRECKNELERLDRGDVGADVGEDGGDDDDETMGEMALSKHTIALTMFRQLGFQPILAPSSAANSHSSSSSEANITALFARSDSKGKVTQFKVGTNGAGSDKSSWSGMDEAQRTDLVNSMWDAVE